MPSSNERAGHVVPPEAVALLERIEELSLLRTLSDRMAAASDLGSACRALTELIWAARDAESVAYVTIDGAADGHARLEAVTPPEALAALADDGSVTALLGTLARSGQADVVTVRRPSWLRGTGTLLWAPTVLRGVLTGGLVIHTRGDAARIVADTRVLAIVAALAALGLDAARGQVREDFLATLRHDIKNPLGVALGYLDMIDDRLAEGAVDRPDLRRCVAAVAKSLQAVDDLVVSYLHLAVIDRGRPAIEKDDVDLGALVTEVVARHAPAAAERGLTLRWSGGTPVVLAADRRQIARVVGNLVDNAIKYTPGPGDIEVTLATEAADVVLAVRDSGLGVKAADLSRLFQKHARLHLGARVSGTGLGLYLSKAIVDAHGGTVTVESVDGCGSTFTVRLPLGRPAMPAVPPPVAPDDPPAFAATAS
jgi:signal transduction histidine kinase